MEFIEDGSTSVVRGKSIIIRAGVVVNGKVELLYAIGVARKRGSKPYLLHGRQEQAYQKSENPDHEENFNQRECATGLHHVLLAKLRHG